MIENEREIRDVVSQATTMHDLLGSVGASDVKDILAEIDALRAKNERLRAALGYVMSFYRVCPKCARSWSAEIRNGIAVRIIIHDDGCLIGQALRLSDDQP